MIDTGMVGGINGHSTSLGPVPHNYMTFYVQVDDLQTYLARAQSLGGKIIVPPVEMRGRGSFAWPTRTGT